MFLNQSEIEALARNRHACPNVRRAVRLLHALMESVNAQSDGWAHWSAPSHAANPLIELLRVKGVHQWSASRATITDAELKKVVTPIKAMVTRQKVKQAKYGNHFDFDVVAALEGR